MLWLVGIEELSRINPEEKAGFILDRLSRAGLDPAQLLGRCTFEPHPQTSLLEVSVSGGADSVALLILAFLSNPNVRVWHLNHQLRPSSGHEAVFVQNLARALSAEVEILHIEVEDGSNLEERARDQRRAAFIDGVATGHTADDLCETMIINLVRGSGPSGLGSMAPGPQHPILDLRRAETEAICRALSIEFVRDESNMDPRFLRNRVRNEVLPLLSDVSHRDVVPILSRTANILRQIANYISSQADELDPTEAKELAAADEIVATEAIRRWLTDERGHSISYELAQDVLRVARGEKGATDLPGAIRVRRSKGKLSKFAVGHAKPDSSI